MSAQDRRTRGAGSGDQSGKTNAAIRVDQHIVEILSDSGEGAQTAGQMFGTVSAKMGLGDKFDIRAFHDALLGGGALPLDILQQRMDQWVEGQL